MMTAREHTNAGSDLCLGVKKFLIVERLKSVGQNSQSKPRRA